MNKLSRPALVLMLLGVLAVSGSRINGAASPGTSADAAQAAQDKAGAAQPSKPDVPATTGDLVRTTNFSTPCPGGTGVGIAFDGKDLWYTCIGSSPAPDLYRANPLTGVVSYSVDIVANGGLGELAYDAQRNAFWASGLDKNIRLLKLTNPNPSPNPKTVVAESDALRIQFTAPCCLLDGLALDGGPTTSLADDWLYFSPDGSSTIYKYSTTGVLDSTRVWAGSGADCQNSGVVVGGQLLYQAGNGCKRIWAANKDTNVSTPVLNFSTNVGGDSGRPEGLECDSVTFDNGATPRHVIWSVEAYEPRRAHAFEIAYGSCFSGGAAVVPSNCYCPMDVAFVVDDTASMQTALFKLEQEFPAILSNIQAASGGDYRLSLVTFKDDVTVWDNWTNVHSPGLVPAHIQNLVPAGGWLNPPTAGDIEPEASDEALRTVLQERPANDPTVPIADSKYPCSSKPLQHLPGCNTPGNFGAWRLGNVRRIVVFITDARPGEFTDKYVPVPALPLQMANLAGWRNIQVVSIGVCANCPGSYAVAAGFTAGYARASNGTVQNGRYIPTSQLGIPTLPENGGTIGDQVAKFISDCPGTAVWSTGPKIFADVLLGDAFVKPIGILNSRGVLGGYPCGGPGEPCNSTNDPYFRPDTNVTRGQASKIVANAAGFEEDVPEDQQTFADVPSDSPFWVYIERASARGVFGGYPCGGPGEPCDGENRPYFRPGTNVTRGQLSKIVANAAGFYESPSGQVYEDIPPASPFYEFVMRLYQRNATNARGCGSPDLPCTTGQPSYFGSNIPATRAETALFVANSFYPEGPTAP